MRHPHLRQDDQREAEGIEQGQHSEGEDRVKGTDLQEETAMNQLQDWLLYDPSMHFCLLPPNDPSMPLLPSSVSIPCCGQPLPSVCCQGEQYSVVIAWG
jgi:hypothetical protein